MYPFWKCLYQNLIQITQFSARITQVILLHHPSFLHILSRTRTTQGRCWRGLGGGGKTFNSRISLTKNKNNILLRELSNKQLLSRLWVGKPQAWGLVLGGGGTRSSLLHSIRLGLVPTQSEIFHGGAADHSPLPNAKFKNVWDYMFCSLHTLMMCCIIRQGKVYVLMSSS